MGTANITRDEASERSRIISTEAYRVTVDLTGRDVADPERQFVSTTSLALTGHGGQTHLDLIADEARRRPGELTLVTLGPATNLAAAVLRAHRGYEQISYQPKSTDFQEISTAGAAARGRKQGSPQGAVIAAETAPSGKREAPRAGQQFDGAGREPGCPCPAACRKPGQPDPWGYRLMFMSSAIMASVVVMTFALAW